MSSINKDLYNKLLARLVLNNRLLSREQLQACWSNVAPDKDLGQVLVEMQLLDFQNYLRLHNYIVKLPRQPDYREKVAEILGQGRRPPAPQQQAPRQPQRQAPPAPSRADAVPISGNGPSIPLSEDPGGQIYQGQATPVQSPRRAPPQPRDVPVQQEAPPADQAAVQQPRPEGPVETEEVLPAEFRGNTGRGKLQTAVPSALSADNSLDEILLFARQSNASDIMLSPGRPIMMRRFTRLIPAGREDLTADQVRRIIAQGLPSEQMERFNAGGDLEYAHAVEGGGRYRLAVVRQRFGWEITARVIPMTIRSFKESGMPPSCQELTKWAQGMVLVTGPLGCGKSSTLATLVQLVNQSKDDHIITVESPVEMVYVPARCQITQREIGLHTHSQDSALRAALRQDPDIMVISELRDLNSISLAISAAETGHLVLATMNTANAYRTINRLIDAFPPDEQEVVRGMISETLRGVISQQLIPRKDGRGVVPAYEVLVVTKAISNLIRKNSTHQIPSAMVSGRNQGMIQLDDSLKQLVKDGVIEGSEAFFRATNPKTFLEYAPKELKELNVG
ncbi:MAG: PilT/PilU family type 4a pilus ATPase [Acidobacteriota bacterium]|nr:PilT/PilU family type 4a pilus ATPase [Acidobacteriota bacterium]